MGHRLLLPLLIALTACTSPPDPATDRRELVAKIEQFNSAIREGDKQKYADVFVDDFVFTWSRNGQIYDRETILPNVVPTPEYKPLVDELMVRIYGDAATVTYRVRKSEDDAGARVTFSYGRIDDVWKVIASHGTKIVTADEDGGEAAQPKPTRTEILGTLKGDGTRVVVVPSDGDDEDTIVAHLVAWQQAGTMHVLPLDREHPERATGLFRMADVIELAGDGPHSVLLEPRVAAALKTARSKGKLVLGEATDDEK